MNSILYRRQQKNYGRHLKSEKPQQNCTFMNSVSVMILQPNKWTFWWLLLRKPAGQHPLLQYEWISSSDHWAYHEVIKKLFSVCVCVLHGPVPPPLYLVVSWKQTVPSKLCTFGRISPPVILVFVLYFLGTYNQCQTFFGKKFQRKVARISDSF